MLKGLKRLAGGGLLLLEIRGLRREVAGLREGVERIAQAFELMNAHQWPQQIQADPSVPATEVSFVSNEFQAELMEIETGLTYAKGVPPNEDEVLAEYHRRHPSEVPV